MAKQPKHWTLTLTNSGFSGVTFSRREDVKYGIRPIPYYEIDGDLELLQEIKNHLFKHGINSTLTETKYFNSLQITGIGNCITLSEVLCANDKWVNSLKGEFVNKTHLTEKGIKKLFVEFGQKSLLTYDDVCNIIDAAKAQRLNEAMKKIFEKRAQLKLLPAFDNLYKTHNTTDIQCMQCGKTGIKIYFLGKYPRPDTTFFLCDSCASAL